MKPIFFIIILAVALFAQEKPAPAPNVKVQVCGPLVVSADQVGAAILYFKETKCKNVEAEPFNDYFVVYATRVIESNDKTYFDLEQLKDAERK